MDPKRRDLLRTALAAGLVASGGVLASRVSLAASGAGEQRFVFVLLRGALDGLAAVPPIGDPDYARLRGELDLSGAATLHRLEGPFALHPSLEFLAASQWRCTTARRRARGGHAVPRAFAFRCTGCARERFRAAPCRAIRLAESRTRRPAETRWCTSVDPGVALGANVPLVMRGPTEVASWSPGRLPDLADDTLQRIADLYSGDAVLSQRLADALSADAIANAGADAGATAGTTATAGAQVEKTARATAEFLRRPDGPRVAVFETTGWDTHANQGSAAGVLALRLRALDAGLRSLREALGATWSNTVVLVATEFGRTVAVNGTRGTDHGTGAAAFLLGGAVRGGRVIGDWPGLSVWCALPGS